MTVNGDSWDHHIPVVAKSGERVELTFVNTAIMAHPMHLHDHSFQVVNTGSGRFAVTVCDTLLVPPAAPRHRRP